MRLVTSCSISAAGMRRPIRPTIGEYACDGARFRASLRRALSGGRHRVIETVLRRVSLSDFNDGCEDFAELRAVILQARAAAMNDADAIPVPHGRPDIEWDEFVMA